MASSASLRHGGYARFFPEDLVQLGATVGLWPLPALIPWKTRAKLVMLRPLASSVI